MARYKLDPTVDAFGNNKMQTGPYTGGAPTVSGAPYSGGAPKVELYQTEDSLELVSGGATSSRQGSKQVIEMNSIIDVDASGGVRRPEAPAAPAQGTSGGIINSGAWNNSSLIDETQLKTGFGTKADPKTGNNELSENYKTYAKASTLLAGAAFVLDVMNANSAYAAVRGEAQLNIMQARNQAADAIYRGREAGMDARSEGRANGDAALLNAAAQGQDVNGAGTQKIKSSYENMGIYNGMRQEINGMREALGYELEEIAYDYQVDMAGISRDNAIIGSALNFGVTAARGYTGTL